MTIRIATTPVITPVAAVTIGKFSDKEAAADKKISASATPAPATVRLNTVATAEVTYPDPRLNKPGPAPDLNAILEESDRKVQNILNLIRPLIEQQGLQWSKLVSGEQKLTADPEAIAAAKVAIAPDGEFGVQKTAERILSFAKAAIGNDPAKLDKIRAAVEQGFGEAANFLGGKLPEISQQTLAAIQTEFDHWKANGIPSGDAVTLAPAGEVSRQK
ncbi:hypothetical protein BH11PSE12_BH11PSE12_09480 [soil metagenome]